MALRCVGVQSEAFKAVTKLRFELQRAHYVTKLRFVLQRAYYALL
jgi:hypothetical protein